MDTPSPLLGRSSGGPLEGAPTRLRRAPEAVVGVAVAPRTARNLASSLLPLLLGVASLLALAAGSALDPARLDPPAAAPTSTLLALAAMLAAMRAANTPTAASGGAAYALLVAEDAPW